MRSGEIALAKQVYVLGEEVTGSVHFSLNKPVSQRSATVSLIGKERTKVTYQAGKSRATAVQESEFLHQETPITLPTDEKRRIKPGEYSIPFRFQLPQGLPTTFNGNHAKIVYAIFERIDVPHWFDIKELAEFNVVSSGAQILRSQPVSAFSDSWKNSQDPGIAFTLEGIQFRRGEILRGMCTFRNPKWKDLRRIDVLLKCIESATARGHRAASEILKESSQISIGGSFGQFTTPFSIRIPEGAPPSYEASLSSISYVLSTRLDIAWGSDVVASQAIRVLP
jgi:hypothetical protein